MIRVNSQSGKGGMAYLLAQEYGLELPRRLQIEFSRAVQRLADETGREIAASSIHALFSQEYLEQESPYNYVSHRMTEDSQHGVQIDLNVTRHGAPLACHGEGNGPVDAFVDGLRALSPATVEVLDYHQHAIGGGAQARAAAYLELRIDGATRFGVGIDANTTTASMKAVAPSACGWKRPARAAAMMSTWNRT